MCRDLSWDRLTVLQAEALLQEWVETKQEITSLHFKNELRRRLLAIDSQNIRNIVQEDVGHWLREKGREGYWEQNNYCSVGHSGYLLYRSNEIVSMADFRAWLRSDGWRPEISFQPHRVLYRKGQVRLALEPNPQVSSEYKGELQVGLWKACLTKYSMPVDLRKFVEGAMSSMEALGAIPASEDDTEEELEPEVDEVHEEFLLDDEPFDLEDLTQEMEKPTACPEPELKANFQVMEFEDFLKRLGQL